MATHAQIREGLAEALQPVLGNGSDGKVSAYMLANPMPPLIQVLPDGIHYHEAMHDGATGKRFIVQALVGLVAEIGAQQKLDLMLADTGTTSVKAAIEEDETLGGIVDDTTVLDASGYKVYALDGAVGPVLGCEWTVAIID